jgi:hypothetical protein
MANVFFDRFLKRESNLTLDYSVVPSDVLSKYKSEFLTEKDEGFDCIYEIWSKSGFCSYRNGLFFIINPEEYSTIARKFSCVPKTAIAFARTGIGCLFLWDKIKYGESIIYLNIHKNEISIVSTSFLVFFGISIGSESWWKDECYGKIELKAIEKHGPIGYDECLAFVPALALGGSESVAKMKKVKVKEHLELLAQIHSGG